MLTIKKTTQLTEKELETIMTIWLANESRSSSICRANLLARK